MGIAGALLVRHHYHHKAQAELKRLQQLGQSGTSSNNGDFWGLSGADWVQGDFKGVQVLGVSSHSTADIAGLKTGDVITSVNGKNVASIQELSGALAQIEPGSTVRLGYLIQTQIAWLPKETTVVAPKGN